jgi:hypothetical protein
MLTITHYGDFQDALYDLACSEHLAWGHVDQPPLIVLIDWTGRHTLGTSLPSLMFWPALFCPCANLLAAASRRKPAPSIRWQETPTRFADDPTDPLGLTSFAEKWIQETSVHAVAVGKLTSSRPYTHVVRVPKLLL